MSYYQNYQTPNRRFVRLQNPNEKRDEDLKEEENKKLKEDNDKLKEEINELEQELRNKTKENQNLNNQIKQYENQLSKKNEEIERMKRVKNKLNIDNQNQDLLNQIKQKGKETNFQNEKEKLEQKIKSLTNELENIQKDSKFNMIEKENLSKDPLEFYDIIGNINSIQNVSTDGWNFYMNEEGFKIDQSKDIAERLVIGVMGNRNKGKSFILQALSGASLKTGTTINTIGISIKYLDNKYVLLDCAGSESPLLGEYANMLEISRDKLFTEAFLERYILRKSNVLLLVVGILTFSEQKLINKISQDLEKLKEKEKKNLVVIHNLQTYESIVDVERYINETLLRSASFKLKKDESNFAIDKETSEFFYDIDNTSVKHFIYAKENSEAGNKYNLNTINSIKSLYQISTSKYKYDYKTTIIEHFKYMSEKMFDGNESIELTEVKENVEVKKESKSTYNAVMKIENKKDEGKTEIKNEFNLINPKFVKSTCKLKYNGKEKLSLQKMVIDELGISSFINNDFVPNLEMYYTDSELIINIECPEGTKLTAKRKRNKNKSQDYPYCIEITAEKEEEPKKENVTYIRNKQYGKFHTLIPFSNSDYSIGKGEEVEKSKDGWRSFKFPLSKVEDDD